MFISAYEIFKAVTGLQAPRATVSGLGFTHTPLSANLGPIHNSHATVMAHQAHWQVLTISVSTGVALKTPLSAILNRPANTEEPQAGAVRGQRC